MEKDSSSAEYMRLQAILEGAVDAIVTIDGRGTIQSANPATKRLFQYEEGELLGQNVKMLMPSPYRDEHDAYINTYLRTGIAKIIGIGREVVGRRKDGSTFPLHLAVSEIHDNGQHIFTGILRDISDVKATEQKLASLNADLEERVRQRTAELEAAQAELVAKEKLATLGKVSGGIAHEIRNPLNAVKTSAYYLLNAKNASDEKRREHLERIDRQVMLIDSVVTALSDVAKLPDPTMTKVSSDEMIRSVIRDVTMPEGVSVEINLPESLPAAFVDPSQIPIVFRNLLRNARDAMPQGGKIVISGEVVGDRLLLHVDDNGVGIDAALMERILEPLYTTKARGMGLGLAICRAIVEKNNGALRIKSELGVGSRFTVELSAADSKARGC